MPNSPLTDCNSHQPIQRIEKSPPASTVGHFGYVPIKTYEKKAKTGLRNIKVKDLSHINSISAAVSISTRELQWLYGKWQMKHECPGWNGFMETSTTDQYYDVSHILYLPFLNAPPNEYDNILSPPPSCRKMQKHSTTNMFGNI